VLVCLPVFVAAPLVRYSPWLSLAMTLGWLGLSWRLYSRPRTRIWGDLLYGFTLTWLAGSFYWGWLRWEPLWHMPVEALGIPMVWWGGTATLCPHRHLVLSRLLVGHSGYRSLHLLGGAVAGVAAGDAV
jgi:hypothetical protein